MARRKELGAFANKSLNITCFTSKLKCSKCGCSYVRNQRKNRTKYTSTYGDTIVAWVCGTTKKKGGRCGQKDIPEQVLRMVCAEALGLEEFDEDVFLERVDYIMVNPNCQLEFHFYDGSTKVQTWKSTAKKDCWTDEQKDRQREWVRNNMATSSKFSPFTTRMVCGCCGGSCRRQTQPSKISENGKIAYWRCSGGTKTNCGIKGIREAEQVTLLEETQLISDMVQQSIYENAHIALDQAEYQKRYDSLTHRFDTAKERLETLMAQLQQMQLQRADIEAFLKSFEELPDTLTEFSAENWHALVDYATVYSLDDIRFTFKHGQEVQA